MKSKTNIYGTLGLSIACLFTINSNGLIAQENKDTLSMDVTFVGEREMVVKDAIKLQSWPEPRRLDGGNRNFSYKLLSKRMNVVPEWTQIDPVRLKVDAPLARLYRGYARVGYGMYNTPLVDLSLTDLRSREGTWGLQGNHVATNTPNDSLSSRFKNSSARVWASRFIGKEKVDISGHISNHSIVYYGNPINDDFMPVDTTGLNQNFINYGSSIALKSHHRDSTKLNHEVVFDWAQMRFGEKFIENNYNGEIEIGKFIGSEKFSMKAKYNFDNLHIDKSTPDPHTINTAIAGLEPSVTTYKGNLTITVGGGLWVDNDDNSRSSEDIKDKLFVYPKVEASISLLKDLFIPYFKYDGGMKQNRFLSVLNDNPFYNYEVIELTEDVNCPLNNTWKKNDILMGMRGTITDAISFNVFGQTFKYDDYMFFKNTAVSGGSKFDSFYHDLRISSVGGNLNLDIGDNFEMAINSEFFTYSYEEIGYNNNWNLPDYTASIDLKHTFIEKLVVKSTTTLVGARNSLSELMPDEATTFETISSVDLPQDYYNITLPAYLDMNLNVEYRYNDRTAIWMSLNNLTNSNYSHWAGYRVQGIQALFGASYAF